MALRSVLGSVLGSGLRGVIAGGGAGSTTARFIGDPYIEGANDSAITIRIRRAAIGASYAYTISSSGGGTPVTDTGTVAAEDFDVTSIDITGLDPGSLSLSYEEDSVEVATDTALLLPPFDVRVTVSGDRRVTVTGDVRIAA